jgi:hypothetical protein
MSISRRDLLRWEGGTCCALAIQSLLERMKLPQPTPLSRRAHRCAPLKCQNGFEMRSLEYGLIGGLSLRSSLEIGTRVSWMWRDLTNTDTIQQRMGIVQRLGQMRLDDDPSESQ